MSFRRLKNIFGNENWDGVVIKGTDVILIDSTSHFGQVVKVGNGYSKTEFTHLYPKEDLRKHIYEVTEEIGRKELIKIRHHLTRRIWQLDGVFVCVDWQNLKKEKIPLTPKLLPAAMCFRCLFEGNMYLPMQLKTVRLGLCRCCNTIKPLHLTAIAWPVDLRRKGFGFTVITTGRNFDINKGYYYQNFDMSPYLDYNGAL